MSCSHSRPETVQMNTFANMTATEKPSKFWEAHITNTVCIQTYDEATCNMTPPITNLNSHDNTRTEHV
jgi:hypothetical protein